MIYQLKKINLSKIRMESNFRSKEKDLSLVLDITRNGLQYALTVEEEEKDQYVLVDGYRRFDAIEYLGIKAVNCIVEKESNEEERIIKKLRKEFHTKRRTSYQLERMINKLLENEKYTPKLIAILCNVTEGTIAKYIRGSDVNLDWLRRGEIAGVGRHAFTDIHNLTFNESVKNYLAEKYINREIIRNSIDIIKKATKVETFKYIPEDRLIDCIDEVLTVESKAANSVEEVVNKFSLEEGYNVNSHTFMHKKILNSFANVKGIMGNKYYFKFLSDHQKDELEQSVRNLHLILNPPIKWSEFPDEKIDNNFKGNDNLEH